MIDLGVLGRAAQGVAEHDGHGRHGRRGQRRPPCAPLACSSAPCPSCETVARCSRTRARTLLTIRVGKAGWWTARQQLKYI